MKTILFIILFSTFLNADYLYKSHCIKSDFYINNDDEICYSLSSDDNNTFICDSNYSIDIIYPDYLYINNTCQHTLNYGLSDNYFNFLMALSGVFFGFLIFQFLIRLS